MLLYIVVKSSIYIAQHILITRLLCIFKSTLTTIIIRNTTYSLATVLLKNSGMTGNYISGNYAQKYRPIQGCIIISSEYLLPEGKLAIFVFGKI
jgi:hypothetical protein